ncbi:MAG: GNAT family N-acetyltransferase [Steroidobacteraceae bacterium]
MGTPPLDNPMWTALTTRQRRFALGTGPVRRYPRDVAPFVAVAHAGVAAAADLEAWVEPGEAVYVVGVAPEWPQGWQVLATGSILQMMRASASSTTAHESRAVPGTGWVELGERDLPAMLALTAQVYPEFFRARTRELGRYIGLWQGGTLAAMAGERLEVDGRVEISAVCTHPGHTGRGHAAALMGVLIEGIVARGATPFLHVSDHNRRAIELYRRLGFVESTRLDLWKVQRPA